ncbi:antitoxin Xre/MbcA/ParS toxin-binding domain-containing protein [Bordetella genomosp. 8]|nr:antitoxin Xre/MbcA/ParS toxin-binding domain-containing protein [Bordetella genomosp. 8]
MRTTTTGAVKTAATRTAMRLVSTDYRPVEYHKDIDAFVLSVGSAAPMALVETERAGVSSRFVKQLPVRMHIPATRLYTMMGIPKATIEKKAAANQSLTGMAGKSALGLARLLGIAQSIVANSTSPEARGFDAVAWLGQWLDSPQPALGGRKPGDLIDTPTGVDVVARLLGALESGAYQ